MIAYPCRPSGIRFSGSLIFLSHTKPGKYAQRANSWAVSGRAITDFDTSCLERLIAVGGEDGHITVAELPESISEDRSPMSLPQKVSVKSADQKAIDVVEFHPTASSLVLSMQGPSLQIWDIARSGGEPVLQAKGPEKGHWSAAWSYDGRLVQTVAKDNTVNLWDLRVSTQQPTAVSRLSLYFTWSN